MAKLNQVIAVEKNVKGSVHSQITELNKIVQKSDLFNGLVKKYEKKDEETEDLPSEKKRVQYTVTDILRSLETSLTSLLDITARKDFTNCTANADVIVNGKVLISKVPVSYLLFLEKNLTDVKTFIGNLPVLDESESWNYDSNSGLYVSDVVKTHRTKKVQKPIVMYPHSPEHPAQTQLITEDVIAGYWNQIKQSGAVPRTRKHQLYKNVDTLLKAVKEARELANIQEESFSPKIGPVIFEFLFAGGE